MRHSILIAAWVPLLGCPSSPPTPTGPSVTTVASQHSDTSLAPALPAAQTAAPRPDTPESRCEQISEEAACGSDAVARHDLRMLSEEGSLFCFAWCENARGQKHGPFTQANVSSYRYHVEGEYEDGAESGTWRRWSRYCPAGERCADRFLKSLTQYRGGKRHGTAESWHDGATIAGRTEWKAGKRHGPQEKWDRRGKAVLKARYINGSPRGTHETFWPNGALSSQRIYDERGLLDGMQCDWAADSTVIVCFRMASGTGTVREYEDAGLIAEIPMKHGKRHGVVKRWDSASGKLVGKTRFRAGVAHGRSQEWRDGCLEFDANYRDGEYHGRYREIECDLATGKPRHSTVGRYCNGERCGTWVERGTDYKRRFRYNASGDVVAKTIWENGRVVESWDVATQRREERAKCLAELKRGGCCDPEQNPPRGAKMCINGSKAR